MAVDNSTIKQLAKEICKLNDRAGGDPSNTEEFQVLEEVITEAGDVQAALDAAWQGVRSHRWRMQSARQLMLGCMASMQLKAKGGRRE